MKLIRRLRPFAYAGAAALFVVAAVLLLAGVQRVGLALAALAGAGLCVGVWGSLGVVAGAVVRTRRELTKGLARTPAPTTDPQLLAAVAALAETLRDLPVVAEQSVVTTETLGRLDHAIGRLPDQLDRVHESGVLQLGLGRTEVERLQAQLAQVAALAGSPAVEQRHRSVMHRFDRLETQVDQAPGLDLELARLARRLQPDDAPLPVPGGWAVGAGTLLMLVQEVLDRPSVQHVVECGSGTSTVWTALAMRHRGSGHVHALEHDPHFAELTRGQLRAQGLQDWATVLDAPLADVDVDGETVRWYDPAALAGLPAAVDLLFVDGPPGDTGPLARRPAYLLLRDRLREGALVVLDDTDRAAEREIAADWLGRDAAHGHLVERGTVGRSTLYDVQADGGRDVAAGGEPDGSGTA